MTINEKNEQVIVMRKSRQLPAIGSALLLLALAGCGGGGSSTPQGQPVTPSEPPPPTLPEGIWETADRSTVAYVLPAQGGAAGELWAVASTGSSPLLQGALSVEGSGFVAGQARYLTSDAAQAADARVSLGATGTGELSFSSTVGSSTVPTVISMTPSTTYQRVAALTEWAGCWQIAGDPIASSFCVSSAGVISGNRGACQLVGTVGLRPEAKAVVNVMLQEQGCAEGQTFNGIGVYARSNGVIVEASRMLALKNVVNTRRSLVGLTKTN